MNKEREVSEDMDHAVTAVACDHLVELLKKQETPDLMLSLEDEAGQRYRIWVKRDEEEPDVPAT